jgi:hypothetical protein
MSAELRWPVTVQSPPRLRLLLARSSLHGHDEGVAPRAGAWGTRCENVLARIAPLRNQRPSSPPGIFFAEPAHTPAARYARSVTHVHDHDHDHDHEHDHDHDHEHEKRPTLHDTRARERARLTTTTTPHAPRPTPPAHGSRQTRTPHAQRPRPPPNDHTIPSARGREVRPYIPCVHVGEQFTCSRKPLPSTDSPYNPTTTASPQAPSTGRSSRSVLEKPAALP